MNKVILIGRLTQDPELRFSQGSNMAVAHFSVAVDKGLSRDKRDEMARQGKPTADFPRVVVFGRQAESCANYLSKGLMVAVEGSIQTGSYTNKEGRKVYTTEVLANRVEFIERANASKGAGQPSQQRPSFDNRPAQQTQNQNQTNSNDDFDSFSQINDDEIPF
ncbi:single-stranded DNA-binding protein [Gottschalkiaceae bacterium SANA]|jgi:single-strand DNA-binding protein|nr:single-stranded DNA-binding protein [Gottschalkiaceae bacterium SANA]